MENYLPYDLIESLQNIAGFDEKEFIATHLSGAQVTSVRYNPDKLSVAAEYTTPSEMTPWCPYGYYLDERPAFTKDPLLHGGLYYVQEASSMFLWHILQTLVPQENTSLKVLDLCAAPGGKSTLLSSYFKNGLVVANEVIKNRASILVENITKWGTPNVVVTNNDPAHFKELKSFFDVIVVDAPCSGSGLFRRDPDAVKEWSEENVELCGQRQQRILSDILPSLKPEGLLIYSTCSYSYNEDEKIADWLINEWHLQNLSVPIPANWNIVTSFSKNNASCYRFYPDKIKGEGFFIAAFQKENDSVKSLSKNNTLVRPSKQETEIGNKWLNNEVRNYLIKQNNLLIAIPEQWRDEIALLQKHLYLRMAGIRIGEIKGKDLVPHHHLATSMLTAADIPIIDTDIDLALNYLRKKNLTILQEAVKGWNIVCYKGINIGWVKVLPGRINNYYPAEWRILKD